MKIQELDPKKLGEMIMRVPLGSHKLNHKWMKSVKDYMNPNSDVVESQFIYDLYTLTTEEMIDKWYGGEVSAEELLRLR
ncbi:hypothetical protein CTV96_09530 [Bacillus altitudinis]|uniref:hypothetical protein n=1 Tax=Bacillus altitudinis TaxID=293387 RepID=UPI000C25035C|nr:hypothetical protein [Bacillus altitudinis]PJI12378.1 hypothetical protein CTV96_09530 [Bacillus altitudinis]PKQ85608.1 hypothetical protein CTV98_007565 [Bacillus altitudinis]